MNNLRISDNLRRDIEDLESRINSELGGGYEIVVVETVDELLPLETEIYEDDIYTTRCVNESPEIGFWVDDPDLPRPLLATAGAGAYDLVNGGDRVVLEPGESAVIETKVHFDIPSGYMGILNVRSSIGAKRDIRLKNSVGWIDSDFPGQVRGYVKNESNTQQVIEKYERVFQIAFQKVETPELVETAGTEESSRGGEGFGTTGRF